MNKIILYVFIGLASLGCISPNIASANESDVLTTKITELTDEFVLLRSAVVEERKDNYNQSFEDESIGVSFAYNAKKPLKVVPVTNVNESKVIARSFQNAKKEALFLSVNDKTTTSQAAFFLSMLSGTTTTEEGTTYIANTAMVKEPVLSRPLMRTDMRIITKQKKESGASMLFYEVRDERNAFIGSISMSVSWGQAQNQHANGKVLKYNGKVMNAKPHFKTKKEADAFLNDILQTLVVDENNVRVLLRNK